MFLSVNILLIAKQSFGWTEDVPKISREDLAFRSHWGNTDHNCRLHQSGGVDDLHESGERLCGFDLVKMDCRVVHESATDGKPRGRGQAD
uniref:Secreted protein n=1 Tax=Angiostrongylus cantonensis TaxID=6313 RepID=A0A0K0DFM6_ANGCA